MCGERTLDVANKYGCTPGRVSQLRRDFQADWERFQFTTEQGGNVTLEELESATHEMDERTYRPEADVDARDRVSGRAPHRSCQRRTTREKNGNVAIARRTFGPHFRARRAFR